MKEVIVMPNAVYIHIPFCSQICHYCDFNKVYTRNQPVEDYLTALNDEIKMTIEKYPTQKIDTIFVGGGTPTALDLVQMEKLIDSITNTLIPYTTNSLEFTFEANPGGIEKEKLNLLRNGGVNRLSFGVQAFQDDLLKRIGRSHTVKDIYETLELSKEAGFTNINLDLIYALPGQTLSQFKETLDQAVKTGVQHFSGYSLQIEPKTVFYNLMRKGKLNLPTEDIEAEMYELLMSYMDTHGYQQYEISNFSKKGLESRHNLAYWNNVEYYGFGAGAHSYLSGVRRANLNPIPHYIQQINQGELPYIEENRVTTAERMEEELFLGLRKATGISKQVFQDKFQKDVHEIFGEQIVELTEKGLLNETKDGLKLTKKGKFLGNEVFQAFLGVVE